MSKELRTTCSQMGATLGKFSSSISSSATTSPNYIKQIGFTSNFWPDDGDDDDDDDDCGCLTLEN